MNMATQASSRKKKNNNKLIALIVIVILVIVGVAAALAYHNIFVQDRDSYEGQLKIAQEKTADGEYEAAEEAYLNALAYKPDDPDTILAFADFYISWGRRDLDYGKYGKAATLLEALQAAVGPNAGIYERLFTLYSTSLDDIEAANRQTLKAYESGVGPVSGVTAAPVISPAGGTFNEPINITITADAGLPIFYSENGEIPTLDTGTAYAEPFKLNSAQPVRVIAVVIFENGLIGWPVRADFTVDYQLAVNADILDCIGMNAIEIQQNRGPLFYVGSYMGGWQYRDKASQFTVVFPSEIFADGESPEITPLPAGAVGRGVVMGIDRLLVAASFPIAPDDLMRALNITEYGIDTAAAGGPHLIGKVNGLIYDFELENEKTVIGTKIVTVSLAS
ncbi:MAG: chitobiase/beta-hexosaminidase C-terminal domain-containing protein [Clostridiales Family XIII bacterium]|jgi:hypothetical protein|nr:chitobiase/beta-hexosaminidase C-terminal domain-containing protein [Clostridiales Family XIII bacterium]